MNGLTSYLRARQPHRAAAPASLPAPRRPGIEPLTRADFERGVVVLELTAEEAERECARLGLQRFFPLPSRSTAPEQWGLV